MWLWAAIARPLKHVVPLPSLVRLARPWMILRGPQRRESIELRLEAFLVRRGRFPWRPPGNCLERSLAAYRILCGAGADPRLVVGVRPGPRGIDGHVWVVLHGRPLAETIDIDTFTSVAVFDSSGRREPRGRGEPDLRGIRWA
jgi:hypothetical protein